jgi:DNA-binding PadR family transcriptional regulator
MRGHGWKPIRRGSLRMWVLSILQQSPRNGAEIMDQIEIASQGWWRPSPGSVYPLLDELEKEGSIKKRDEGKYELTDKGQKEFEWPWGIPAKQPRTVEEMITEMNGYISYLEDLNRSDKSKIRPLADLLRSLKDRLTTLVESL